MKERVLKYEASAGSGKTYKLTLEFLVKLFEIFYLSPLKNLRECDIQKILSSILAITFTNKAANEMKERILDKLKKLSLSQEGFNLSNENKIFLADLSKESKISENKILELSSFILETIISNYNDFNVKTIDSLMSSIVQVISPDLRLPPNFEIGVDASIDLKIKARQYIEFICDNDWDLIQAFMNDLRTTEKFKKWRVDEEIIDLITAFYSMYLRKDVTHINGESFEGIKSKFNRKFKLFREELKNLFAVVTQEPCDSCKNKYLNGNVVNQGLIKIMHDMTHSERVIENLNLLVSKSFFKKNDASKCLKQDALPEYGEKFVKAFYKAKKELSDLIYVSSLYRVMNFSRFFYGFSQFWLKDKTKIFVEEFSRTIRDRIKSWQDSALPYIYLKLSDRFSHFLFDEFQDTSELQFKALSPLIDEALSSNEKASFFMVGDRKQAIYRWRGGNSELMNEEILRNEILSLNLASERSFSKELDKNWRSEKGIVGFNNTFWDPKNIIETIPSKIVKHAVLRNFKNSIQKIPDYKNQTNGFVTISVNANEDFTSNKKEQILFDEIFESIQKSRNKGYKDSDIAILVRKNEDGRDIIKFLSLKGINAISDESLLLSSSPVINEIISFFKFLDFPPDNLSFYSFVNGEIFQTSAKKLFKEEMKGFDESVFIEASGSKPFYKIFKSHFPGLWKYFIEPFFKSVGFLPLYDIFHDMMQKFKLYENFKEYANFFLSFGEFIHDLEQKEIHSISCFLDEWKRLIEGKSQQTIDNIEYSSGIRVMTIHKAKGLEFPVVILPIKDSRPKNKRTLFLDNGMFYHISKDYASINQELKRIYLKEIEKDYIDNLNLLYVAFTRARNAQFIHIVTKKLPPQSSGSDEFKRFGNFAEIILRHPMIDSDKGLIEFGKFSEKECKEKEVMPTLELPLISKKILTKQWQKEFLIFSYSKYRTESEEQGMERGEIIHKILAKIKRFDNKGEIKPVLNSIIEEMGLEKDYVEMLFEFLSLDEVFQFFNPTFDVFNEKEIIKVTVDRYVCKRIDRLNVRGDEVIVIDYKTGREKKEVYREQIREYVDIIRPMLKNKKSRAFLLYPDLKEVEEVIC